MAPVSTDAHRVAVSTARASCASVDSDFATFSRSANPSKLLGSNSAAAKPVKLGNGSYGTTTLSSSASRSHPTNLAPIVAVLSDAADANEG